MVGLTPDQIAGLTASYIDMLRAGKAFEFAALVPDFLGALPF